MAKDFAGNELRIRDFVVLPAQFGVGLRYAIVSFAELDENSVSLFTDDLRIAHRYSLDCLRVAAKFVPVEIRRELLDGMMGSFHPKEGK